MARFLAGALACFLLMTGAFLIWQSRAAQGPSFPKPAAQSSGSSSLVASEPLAAPEASKESREQRRFGRYDKNKDGKVESDEYLDARRRNFDKLDADHNGALSFQEYAIKGIQKFQGADGDHSGWLTAAEFATTAPPPPKRKSCSCGTSAPVVAADDSSGD